MSVRLGIGHLSLIQGAICTTYVYITQIVHTLILMVRGCVSLFASYNTLLRSSMLSKIPRRLTAPFGLLGDEAKLAFPTQPDGVAKLAAVRVSDEYALV
jgi:hypothetical protein